MKIPTRKIGKAGIMSLILWTAFNATSLFAQTLPASGSLSGSYTASGTYTGSYTLTGATTITVTGTATISGVISSASSTRTLTKEGAGTLALTGTNTYPGATTINAGTLSIGNGGMTGEIAGNVSVAAGATLIFGRSNDYTYAGMITGSGNVLKNQTLGALTLSGASNAFSGTITTNGALILSGSMSSSSFTLSGGSTAKLDVSSGNKTIHNLNSTIANSSVILGSSTLTVYAAADCSFAGIISGTGGITKTGSGTLTLTGANTYTGETIMISTTPSTLTLSGSGTIASSSNVRLNAANNELNIAGGNKTIQNLSSTFTSSSVTLGSNVLTIDINSSRTFSGVISGTGGIIKKGTATLILGNENIYIGPTTIDEGQLTLQSSGAIAASSGVTINNTATLDISAAKTIKALNSASPDAKVTLGSNVLTIDNSDNCTFAGVISGTSASGLTKTGSGTLSLTGKNTYTGPTTISEGALFVGYNTPEGAIAGDITNNATLYFMRSNNYTYNRVISGSGAVYQNYNSTTATLTFGGVNIYTGATHVLGRLTLNSTGSIANSSSVTLESANALLSVSSSNKTVNNLKTTYPASGVQLGSRTLTVNCSELCNISGKISGTGGGITKTGSGKLTIVSGSNDYTGETIINEGTLSGYIAKSSGVTLNGSGKLETTAGIQTIQNLNSASASSEVILGNNTLYIGNGSGSNGGGSFAGVFSGTGGNVTKQGMATFTLSNSSNTATGAFTCEEGTVVLSAGNWRGNFDKIASATLTVEGTCAFNGNLSMKGGITNMDLGAAEPSQLEAKGILSALGTNTLNITGVGSASSYEIIRAASGVNMNDFTLTGEPGTLYAPTTGVLVFLSHIPVTDITGVATTATAFLPLTLSGTVVPAGATKKSIVWTVDNAGTTGATIASGVLNTTNAGTVKVLATITQGASSTADYTQTFDIVVTKAALSGAASITGSGGGVVFDQTLTALTSGLTSTPVISPLGAFSYQWRRNGTDISGATSSTYKLVQADIGSVISVVVTAANCSSSVTSADTPPVAKALPTTAPAAPTIASKTATSITLNTVAGCEYDRGGGTWQPSSEFTGLTPNTSYSFTQRYAETATHLASPASPAVAFSTDADTGISEITADKLSIYPNPANDFLYFGKDATPCASGFTITDLQGRVLLKSEMPVTSVNISHLPAGIYFVRTGNETVKMIKQ